MSRLFLPNRFYAKYSLLSARDFPLMRQRGTRFQPLRSEQRNVFMQQQRRLDTVGSNSRFWLCGVGVGIALVAGLKYYRDPANGSCDDKVTATQITDRFSDAIRVSRDLVERIKVGAEAEVGAPGLVVSVSVDGVQVWAEGIGYADLENRVPCSPGTVLRIASISKTLTSAAAARLCEEGKLDLDVPVQKYVPEFPQKQFDGQDVTITPRMILSHLSGIRHYEKDVEKVKEDREKAKRLLKPLTKKKEDKISTEQNSTDKKSTQPPKKNDSEYNEFYLKDNFESVIQALDLFKNDPLIFPPGTTFLYSTHAYTLLSAVLERAAGQSFLDLMKEMFSELGMVHTVPEENDSIIYHRSRFYHLNKRGRVVNSQYVDNSYKWAGGGFLSTAGDVLLLGNALLYSYQVAKLKDTEGLLPGFLNPQTAINLWTPVDRTEGTWDKDGLYAQGWLVVEKLQKYGQCRTRRHYMSHTGGAVGASSVILVLPSDEIEQLQGQTPILPQGVVVSIITNMQSVGLNSTALKIAHEFDKARRLQE